DGSVERVHMAAHRGRVDDAVRGRERSDVEAAGRVCDLPEDLAGRRIECRPGARLDRPTVRELVGEVVEVRLGDVDALAVCRRAPFDAAERRAGADGGAPDDLPR